MIDRETSLRLDFLRFPLVVGVVFIHSYSSTTMLANGTIIGTIQPNIIVDFIRIFISQGIARIAVPLFFLMSGYLFFSCFVWSAEGYINKLKSRIKTLVIPFLFWNISTLIIIAIAQAIPFTKTYFSGNTPLVSGFYAYDYLDALTGLTRTHMPIAYQFWFIRDLIILILLAPLINIAINIAPITFMILESYLWISNCWPLSMPSSEATTFFCLGAYLGSTNKKLFYQGKISTCIIVIYLITVTLDVLTKNQAFNLPLHKIGLTLGVSAALSATRLIHYNVIFRSLILDLSDASFFVYAIHEPLLTILKKIAYRFFLPESPYEILALYLSIPTVTIIIAVKSYRLLLRMAPQFTSIITGGRTRQIDTLTTA